MTFFSRALSWAVLDAAPRNPLRRTCSHQPPLAANKLYTTNPHHPNPFNCTKQCFTPSSFELYTQIFHSKQPLHDKGFTPRTVGTKNSLHQTPFTQKSFYTQMPFRVNYFNTENPFTPDNFYTKNLLYQAPLHQTPLIHKSFYTEILLHQAPFYKGVPLHSKPFAPETLTPNNF